LSTPFLGEIKLVPFPFAPKGWAFCNGQLLPIAQNQALFALLGTTFGGNGQTNFALPNFAGRVPLHFGQSPGTSFRSLGETGGTESVTLTLGQIPAHVHLAGASTAAPTTGNPSSTLLAQSATPNFGNSGNPAVFGSVNPAGGSQPHENRQPFLGLNFVIALVGTFPSQN
jgi:microcystin-dependent protein